MERDEIDGAHGVKRAKAEQQSLAQDEIEMIVKDGNLDVVHHFMEKGLIGPDDWLDILKYAIKRRQFTIAKLLLERDVKSIWSTQALNWACTYGSFDIAQMALKMGALPNTKQGVDAFTSLHRACETGHLPIVQLLLENGADLNAKTEDEQTPFFMACVHDNFDIAQLLLSKGADLNAKDDWGSTPLFLEWNSDNWSMARFLLDNGANPNAKNNNGRTPLFDACLAGNFVIAQMLLENGADPNVEDRSGDSPLSLACLKDHSKCVQLLLRYKALVSENVAKNDPQMKICRDIQQARLLLCLTRKFRPDSVWSEDNLPLDMFRLILKEYTLQEKLAQPKYAPLLQKCK